jgi:predicted porin
MSNHDIAFRETRLHPGAARLARFIRLGLAAAAATGAMNVAQAQTAPVPSTPSTAAAVDEGLSWHGITLYGIVDLGFQYETHGAPFSDYHPAGSSNIVQKYSRESVEGLTPSNLSQSRVGLQGVEPLGVGDFQGVFRLETFFNPQSGDLSDAQKSQVLNNGKAANQQTTNLNSSVAGEAFETAYAGFASKTFGSATFGRQTTLVADGISKYDPNYGSQAFSLIGMSGTYAGAGDTEDKRVDNSLKYSLSVADILRFGAFYKFNNASSAASTLFQVDAGADYAGASIDLYFDKTRDGISNSPLSAAQVTGLPALGYSITNSLAATVSDNTVVSLMGSYTFGPVKFLAGYEYLQYDNPKDKLAAGFVDIGGYIEAYVNNTAFPHPKILNNYWAGVRYTALPGLDLTAAYYGYHQNSYGVGATAGCNSTVAATCSGYFEAFSFDADYAFTKRFDAYAGAMYSAVYNGVANGYTSQRNNINPTIGVRFKF